MGSADDHWTGVFQQLLKGGFGFFGGLAGALTLEGQFLDLFFQRGHGVIGLGQLRFDIGQGFALFELGNALVHQLLVRGLRFGVFVPLFGQVFQFHGLSFRE